jgi:hypothetical protein
MLPSINKPAPLNNNVSFKGKPLTYQPNENITYSKRPTNPSRNTGTIPINSVKLDTSFDESTNGGNLFYNVQNPMNGH